MTNRRAALGIMAFLACTAVILWLGVTPIDPDYQCGTKSLERTKRAVEVSNELKPLFKRQPGFVGAETGFLIDERTIRSTKSWGILVFVKEKVDQDTLPLEDRIPEELDGVPIQIVSSELRLKHFAGRTIRSRGDIDPQYDLVRDVIRKNRALLDDYPFSDGPRLVSPSPWSETTPGDRIWGIELWVTKKVYNRGLSPTVRIPDCLEDVPVTFRVVRKFTF